MMTGNSIEHDTIEHALLIIGLALICFGFHQLRHDLRRIGVDL